MNNVVAMYLSVLGIVDVLKSERSKHALLDYIEMAQVMEMLGAVAVADDLIRKAGAIGISLLVAEGHKLETLKGNNPDNPIVLAIKRLDSEARAKQEASQAKVGDPFNGIRFPQSAAKG